MYQTFYSLARTPFAKEIKSSEFFPSSPYQEMIARLEYMKKTRGMGLIVGEPSAGKTFALRCFAESLNPSLFKVLSIFLYLPVLSWIFTGDWL